MLWIAVSGAALWHAANATDGDGVRPATSAVLGALILLLAAMPDLGRCRFLTGIAAAHALGLLLVAMVADNGAWIDVAWGMAMLLGWGATATCTHRWLASVAGDAAGRCAVLAIGVMPALLGYLARESGRDLAHAAAMRLDLLRAADRIADAPASLAEPWAILLMPLLAALLAVARRSAATGCPHRDHDN